MTPDVITQTTLLWRRLDHPGIEHFRLTTESACPRLKGFVIFKPDDKPLLVDYEIECTARWQTRRARIVMEHGARSERLDLTCDAGRIWRRDGLHLPALDGCDDVDLGITPSTNTLPIRRLALSIGERSAVTAAWIRFPQLTIEPLEQTYERIGDRLYRYASAGGAFTAELRVDHLGIVMNYPPAWERVPG
ncbi:MAG TPA: putative glycolipid-binding domain-containing protein [Gemmatimonadaceae bacterium]|nr:putative glycolipid-binding domain-containing protein [Gemmatimonadaceae bacterium]